jgi:hypothetical protein
MPIFPNQWIGKLLVVAGIALVLLGLFFLFGPKIPFLGKLPGDIHIKGKNVDVYIPIVTCLLLSLLLTIILNLFFRR